MTVPLDRPRVVSKQGSTPYGGQFTVTLPFSFTGGTVTLDSVGVVLTNSIGSSPEMSTPY